MGSKDDFGRDYISQGAMFLAIKAEFKVNEMVQVSGMLSCQTHGGQKGQCKSTDSPHLSNNSRMCACLENLNPQPTSN